MIGSTWFPASLSCTSCLLGLNVPMWLFKIALGLATLILMFDAIARYLEYVHLSIRFQSKGLDARLLDQFSRSRCRREVAITAAAHIREEGFVKNYYYLLGYRWYHIFPDGTFTATSPFLQFKFWRNVVGFRRWRG